MSYILSVVAGLIQGFTEFLPISSSGHLILFHEIFNFSLSDDAAFDVILHLGTLGALVLYFRQDLARYVKGFVRLCLRPDLTDPNQRLALYLALATLPAATVGLVAENWIENTFRHPLWVAVMLAVFGIILYAADRWSPKVNELERLSWWGAVGIGCAQILSLIPGVSRSGITIIAGLASKLQRGAAARFSFLLGIPVTAGAVISKIFDDTLFVPGEMMSYFLGLAASFISGYLCIKYFLVYISKHSLAVFTWYRLTLAASVVVWWLSR